MSNWEREQHEGRMALLEAIEHVQSNPTRAKQAADAAICQLLLERSNLDCMDLRAGLYLCIREAIRAEA